MGERKGGIEYVIFSTAFSLLVSIAKTLIAKNDYSEAAERLRAMDDDKFVITRVQVESWEFSTDEKPKLTWTVKFGESEKDGAEAIPKLHSENFEMVILAASAIIKKHSRPIIQ